MRSNLLRLSAFVALCGTIASSQVLTRLYSFGANPNDGNFPLAGIAFDKAGNIYGSAAIAGVSGRGTIYRLSPGFSGGNPWTETTLRQFHGLDGDTPEGRLVVTADGRLFGTTLNGGPNNAGIVFELSPPSGSAESWEERIISSFGVGAGDATHPNQGLLATSKGFFGVSFEGGVNGKGTVFLLSPPQGSGQQWVRTILHSFGGGIDGAFPLSELNIDSQGNLYGTTLLGGAANVGAVFQIKPPQTAGGAWTETVIHSFAGPDGSSPSGRLELGPDGVLYGTTGGGGNFSEGTVFSLTPPSGSSRVWKESLLFSFTGGRDGGNPDGGVTLGSQGRLFGSASTGGPNGGGAVFALTPPSTTDGLWTETLLHAFNRTDGFAPESQLVLTNGRLWGTTTQGGEFGTGTVFALTP